MTDGTNEECIEYAYKDASTFYGLIRGQKKPDGTPTDPMNIFEEMEVYVETKVQSDAWSENNPGSELMILQPFGSSGAPMTFKQGQQFRTIDVAANEYLVPGTINIEVVND